MDRAPVGVVLAGGQGRRLGGDKAVVALDGIPLLRYPLEALRQVTGDVAVVVKEDTVLPRLDGSVRVLVEPDEPRHPLVGVRHALEVLERPVLCCPVDLPLIDELTLRAVWQGATGSATGAVAAAAGRVHPLVALFTPEALPGLRVMGRDEPARDVVARLRLRHVELASEDRLRNVNEPEDLLTVGGLL